MLSVVRSGNVTLKTSVSAIVSERSDGMSGTKAKKGAGRRGHIMRRFIIFVM